MSTKLTSDADEDAIETRKRIVAQAGKSLSGAAEVEDWLLLLGKLYDQGKQDELYPVSRGLRDLVGVGAGPFDEADYRHHRMARQS